MRERNVAAIDLTSKMAKFGWASEGTLIPLLVLAAVDAKTPSATTWTGGGSLTTSAFVAPRRRRNLKKMHVSMRKKGTVIVGDTRGYMYSPKAMNSPRRHVSLLARPKPSDEEMEQCKEELRTLLCASNKNIEKLVSENPFVLNRTNAEKPWN